jgi:hypothetical protein
MELCDVTVRGIGVEYSRSETSGCGAWLVLVFEGRIFATEITEGTESGGIFNRKVAKDAKGNLDPAWRSRRAWRWKFHWM